MIGKLFSNSNHGKHSRRSGRWQYSAVQPGGSRSKRMQGVLTCLSYFIFALGTVVIGSIIIIHNSVLMRLPVNKGDPRAIQAFEQVDNFILEARENARRRKEQYSLHHFSPPVSFHLEQRGKDDMWIETTSWSPNAIVIHNLLTDSECEHLIALANPSMERSTVILEDNDDPKKRREGQDEVRNSKGTFLPRLNVSRQDKEV